MEMLAFRGRDPKEIAIQIGLPVDVVQFHPVYRFANIEAKRIGQVEQVLHGAISAAKCDSPAEKALTPIQRAFLAAYRVTLSITKSAAAVGKGGIQRQSHYRWLEDPDYAAAFDASHRVAMGCLRTKRSGAVSKASSSRCIPTGSWSGTNFNVVAILRNF
jgi:hypothetical protein